MTVAASVAIDRDFVTAVLYELNKSECIDLQFNFFKVKTGSPQQTVLTALEDEVLAILLRAAEVRNATL